MEYFFLAKQPEIVRRNTIVTIIITDIVKEILTKLLHYFLTPTKW